MSQLQYMYKISFLLLIFLAYRSRDNQIPLTALLRSYVEMYFKNFIELLLIKIK